MLRIRLRRTGAKKKPNYRVVIADARAPRDGAFLDILGHYNPLTDPSTVVIDAAKAQKWLANGAQPSDRVARLLQREGITAKGVVTPDPEAVATSAPVSTAATAPASTSAAATAGTPATVPTAENLVISDTAAPASPDAD